MSESSQALGVLRRRIADLERRQRVGAAPVARPPVATGHDAIDRAIGGGLARARLHELVAADVGDGTSVRGFAAMLGVRFGGPLLWIGADATLYGPGLLELGLDPNHVTLLMVQDEAVLLAAAADVLRCPAVGVAVIEAKRLDLTASRRLTLAAEAAGTTALVLRIGGQALPSAAQTRWRIAAAPSPALEPEAPGHPSFDVELLRQRGGIADLRWRVEWNRDRQCFIDPALSGAMVSVPDQRPAARLPGGTG